MKVNPNCGLLAALSALVLFLGMPASAQDQAPEPETWGEDAKYVSITFVQFKQGKREEAMEIISEYFAPAGQKAGTPPPMLDVHFQTGVWDAMFIWNLKGGMADLEWYRSEDNIKWYSALVELNGGPEGAAKIMERWRQTIRESETQVGHYHADQGE
jgi:hypothetical protein